MKQSIFVLALAIAGSLLTGCATKPESPVQPVTGEIVREVIRVPGMAGGMETVVVKQSAVVTAIDQEKRMATLKDPKGNSFTVHAGPEMLNFDQIVAGDRVDVEIVQEITAFVTEAGSGLTDAALATAVRAKKGGHPGGVISETVQVVATIVDLDVWSRMVTLQFEDGTVRSHSVRPDVIMEGYEVGDQVVIQITEMVAVDVVKN